MKAPEAHRHAAPRQLSYRVVTVSTSRYRQMKEGQKVNDESGDVAKEMIAHNGDRLAGRELISDDPRQLRAALRRGLRDASVDVILFTGGTGVSTTDVTIETLRPLFDKEIEGFGELLRRVSYDRIGAAAALTRATAGTTRGKAVLCLPGSPDAVKTALETFMSEIPHVIFLARGQTHTH